MRLNRTLAGGMIALMLAGCSLASEPIPAGPIESGPGPGEEVPADIPISAPSAAEGQVIFAARCASCHGAEGTGDGQFAAQLEQQGAQLPDFSDAGLADQRTPQDWYATITLGTINNGGLMPPWRDALSDAERWNVTYYLYSLSQMDDELAQGDAVFAENCAACHGEGGEAEGVLADVEWVSTMSPRQIEAVLVSGDPHDFEGLSADDLHAVVRYARTLAYDASLTVAEAEPTAEASQEPSENVPVDSLIVQGSVETAEGAAVPEGTEIKLTGVAVDESGEFTTFLENTTTTDAEGGYRFENLPINQATGGAAYVVSTMYNGVEFSNGGLITAEEPVMDLPITVREVTTDDADISVDSAHLVIRQHPDSLLVLQVIIYSNMGDKVYLSEDVVQGGSRGSVAIQLPPDAQNISFEDGALGGRFVEVNGAIYDTLPVQPGERSHNIIVQYVLPYNGSREIDLPMPYGAGQITVLGQGDGEISSEQVVAAGTETIGGEVFNKYIGQSLPHGSTLSMHVGPKGIAGSLSGLLGGASMPLLLGIGTLLIVGGGVYWYMSRRLAGEDLTPALEALSDEADAAIKQIAALDDEYDAGKINRLEYEARRAELKARVAEGLQEE